jgi:hypothetical protein
VYKRFTRSVPNLAQNPTAEDEILKVVIAAAFLSRGDSNQGQGQQLQINLTAEGRTITTRGSRPALRCALRLWSLWVSWQSPMVWFRMARLLRHFAFFILPCSPCLPRGWPDSWALLTCRSDSGFAELPESIAAETILIGSVNS